MKKDILYLIIFFHLIIYAYISLFTHNNLEILFINNRILINDLFLSISLPIIITIYILNIKIIIKDIFLESIFILLFLSLSLFIIKLYSKLFFYSISYNIANVFSISLYLIYFLMFYGFLIYEPLRKINTKEKTDNNEKIQEI